MIASLSSLAGEIMSRVCCYRLPGLNRRQSKILSSLRLGGLFSSAFWLLCLVHKTECLWPFFFLMLLRSVVSFHVKHCKAQLAIARSFSLVPGDDRFMDPKLSMTKKQGQPTGSRFPVFAASETKWRNVFIVLSFQLRQHHNCSILTRFPILNGNDLVGR